MEQSSNEQASTTFSFFPLTFYVSQQNQAVQKSQCGYILFFFKWMLQWVFIEIHVPSRGWKFPQRFHTTTWEGCDDHEATCRAKLHSSIKSSGNVHTWGPESVRWLSPLLRQGLSLISTSPTSPPAACLHWDGKHHHARLLCGYLGQNKALTFV